MSLVRHPSRLNPPIAFAHRGAKAHAPENTLEAFSLALRLGATGLESDVWITRDHRLVFDHDGVVRRGLRRIRFEDLDRSELPEHIPTLDDLLSHCGDDFQLSLDVKDPAAGPPLIDAVERAGIAERTWLCQPDSDLLASWRERSSVVRLVHSTRHNRLEGGAERHIATITAAGIDVINMPVSDWSGGLVTMTHRFERLAFAWDAHNERLLRNAVRMGVDAVYSDHVDVMMEVMAAEA